MVNLENMHRTHYQQISDWDLGSTYVYKNKVLLIKSSNQLFFYELELDQEQLITQKAGNSNPFKWVKYYEMDVVGFVVA